MKQTDFKLFEVPEFLTIWRKPDFTTAQSGALYLFLAIVILCVMYFILPRQIFTSAINT